MLSRLRQAFWLLVAVAVGYALGSGPFAEWVVDVWRMLQVGWLTERTARGSGGGVFPLLLAGFLLGQGIYLLARRFFSNIEVARIRNSERIAAWDPALQLATRFGLHRYLEQCVAWAAEDPTARTQCLALFKIKGLGALNEQQSTLITTRLLQRIAIEVRQAALPVPASYLKRWLTHYMPRPINVKPMGMPAPRYAARWSGATFALAFRELDAVQAVGIARDVAAWIRHELSAIDGFQQLTLSAGIAIGIPSASARGLASAAVRSLEEVQTEQGLEPFIKVVHDSADVRAKVIAQMTGVADVEVTMGRHDPNADATSTTENVREKMANWTRKWGPSIGCILGAGAVIELTGHSAPVQASSYPWPDSLKQIQIVDNQGPHSINLERQALNSQSALGWTISDALMIQGKHSEGQFNVVQVRVRVTNGTPSARYISALNFTATDARGVHFGFVPQQMLRLAQGITGKWLKPGESWLGWMRLSRGDSPLTSLVFEPNSQVRIVLESQNLPKQADSSN